MGQFDDGRPMYDGEVALLPEIVQRLELTRLLGRTVSPTSVSPGKVGHSAQELVAQRAHAITMGYEGLNGQDVLLADLALAAGMMTGADRARLQQGRRAWAGPSGVGADGHARRLTRSATRCFRAPCKESIRPAHDGNDAARTTRGTGAVLRVIVARSKTASVRLLAFESTLEYKALAWCASGSPVFLIPM